MKFWFKFLFLAGLVASSSTPSLAGGTYSDGASDTEIKIGQTAAYSGPGSAIAALGMTQIAYFERLNAAGGINGRKVTWLSYDDGYTPAKTVEMVRKLVEQDRVLAIMGSNGAANNLAVRDYLKSKGVPQLFIIGGNWNDPKNYPTTTGATHSYDTEGRVYGRYILQNKPDAKIAVLYQNDDYGKETLRGLKQALGEKAGAMIVSEVAYDRTVPTIESEIAGLAASKADVFLNASYGKFAAQAIRRSQELGWKPLHLLVYGASSAVLQMPEDDRKYANGIVSATFYKNPNDPSFAKDEDMVAYKAFLAKWAPNVKENDPLGVNGYIAASLAEYVLRQAGDDLTRKNIVAKATNINELKLPLLLPGVSVTVQPDNYAIFRSGRLQRFDGNSWVILDQTIKLD